MVPLQSRRATEIGRRLKEAGEAWGGRWLPWVGIRYGDPVNILNIAESHTGGIS
jgi:hypothetical protein